QVSQRIGQRVSVSGIKEVVSISGKGRKHDLELIEQNVPGTSGPEIAALEQSRVIDHRIVVEPPPAANDGVPVPAQIPCEAESAAQVVLVPRRPVQVSIQYPRQDGRLRH